MLRRKRDRDQEFESEGCWIVRARESHEPGAWFSPGALPLVGTMLKLGLQSQRDAQLAPSKHQLSLMGGWLCLLGYLSLPDQQLS